MRYPRSVSRGSSFRAVACRRRKHCTGSSHAPGTDDPVAGSSRCHRNGDHSWTHPTAAGVRASRWLRGSTHSGSSMVPRVRAEWSTQPRGVPLPARRVGRAERVQVQANSTPPTISLGSTSARSDRRGHRPVVTGPGWPLRCAKLTVGTGPAYGRFPGGMADPMVMRGCPRSTSITHSIPPTKRSSWPLRSQVRWQVRHNQP